MGVRGFAPSMVGGPCRPRPASKIITPNREPWFFGTDSGSVYEPLMGGSFCVGNGEGIEVLAKPIFIRGVSPFNGSGTAAPFNGRHASRPLHPKSLRQIGGAGVFGTDSGSVYEPLMGGSFCVGNGEGIEVLAKPIFIRGVSPFNGSGTAAPFNGRHASRPLHPKSLRQIGGAGVFGTNSRSVYEPLMGGSFFVCGLRRG